MILWLLLIVVVFVAGLLTGQKSRERSPKANDYISAGAVITTVLFAFISIEAGEHFRMWWLLIFPFIFGCLFGLALANDKAKADEQAAAEAERQKRIANQQWSFCPVCSTALIPKQVGERGTLGCPSCPWMKEEKTQ